MSHWKLRMVLLWELQLVHQASANQWKETPLPSLCSHKNVFVLALREGESFHHQNKRGRSRRREQKRSWRREMIVLMDCRAVGEFNSLFTYQTRQAVPRPALSANSFISLHIVLPFGILEEYHMSRCLAEIFPFMAPLLPLPPPLLHAAVSKTASSHLLLISWPDETTLNADKLQRSDESEDCSCFHRQS